jgi:hypothetical protein
VPVALLSRKIAAQVCAAIKEAAPTVFANVPAAFGDGVGSPSVIPCSGVPSPHGASRLTHSMNHCEPCFQPKRTRPRLRRAHAQPILTPIPSPIQINRSRHSHYDHSPRRAPPIPRRIASSKRLFASASRCEKPYLFIRYFRENQQKTLDHHLNHSLHNGSVTPKSLATNGLRSTYFRARNSVICKYNRCKELTL